MFRAATHKQGSTTLNTKFEFGAMDLSKEAESLKFGRHLVLSRNVQAGTIVVQQQPYAAALYNDQVSQRCDYCFAASESLMRCGRSKFAYYCCQAHQKAAWRAYYKQECNALVACAPNIPPATVRLAARVLWRRAREQQSSPSEQQQQAQQQQQLSGGTYADIEQLHSHWDKLDGARKIMYAQMAALTRQYMQGGSSTSRSSTQQAVAAAAAQQHPQQQQQQQRDDNSIPDVKQIAQLLARFACNNHTVCDDELRPIGVGIYPYGALVNHSCRPNCTQSFEGRSIVFRALSPLSAGEQLTISYVELAATRQERKRQLQQQYFFDIDAAAAAADTTPPITTSDVLQAAAATAATGVPAGVQQMLIQYQLPDTPLQLEEHQQIAWQGSSSSIAQAAAASPSSSSAVLLRYARRSPPWPEDAADEQLCQVLLSLPADTPHSSSNSSSSSSKSKNGASGSSNSVRLPGGMCVFTGQQLTGTAAACNDDSAAAAGLFSDLEKLQVDSRVETLGSLYEDAEDDTATVQNADIALQYAENGQCSSTPSKQQQQQLEVVQWGDWSQAAAAAAAHAGSNSNDMRSSLVLGAATTLLQLWALQQQAEQLAAAGRTAAAVQQYQQALAVADGAVQMPAATVVTAAEQETGTVGVISPDSSIDTRSSSSSSSHFQVTLGPKHILRMRVTAGLLKAAIDEGSSWRVALAAARELVSGYELVYPKVSPNLGLHYALLAKLELFHQHIAPAAAAITKAAEILQVTHSGSAAVLQEVMRMRYQVQQEMAAYEQMTA